MLIPKQANSICIRCGQVRIFYRKWKDRENGKGSIIIHEQTVCPDAVCQKLVDEKFKEILDRRVLSEDRRKSIIISRTGRSKA